MALPDPTRTSPDNWKASCVITRYLVSALRGQVPFWTADHAACFRDGRTAVRRQSFAKAMASLEVSIAGASGVFTLSIAMGDEEWGLDDSAAINSKWDGAGSAGMVRSRHPALWPRAPRPHQKL